MKPWMILLVVFAFLLAGTCIVGEHVEHQEEEGVRGRRDIVNGAHSLNSTMSMNETTTLEPGRCTKKVSVIVTFAQSFKVSAKVPVIVRCGWLHLAKCKIYKLEYKVAYRQATRVQYATVRKCCAGFMEVNGTCEPIGGRTTMPPPPTTTMTTTTTTPMANATTTEMMTTTYEPAWVIIDDKIQKLVTAIIVIVIIVFTLCVIIGCLIHVCKICKKKSNYV